MFKEGKKIAIAKNCKFVMNDLDENRYVKEYQEKCSNLAIQNLFAILRELYPNEQFPTIRRYRELMEEHNLVFVYCDGWMRRPEFVGEDEVHKTCHFTGGIDLALNGIYFKDDGKVITFENEWTTIDEFKKRAR